MWFATAIVFAVTLDGNWRPPLIAFSCLMPFSVCIIVDGRGQACCDDAGWQDPIDHAAGRQDTRDPIDVVVVVNGHELPGDCTICLVHAADAPTMQLTCGHQFHTACIREWITRTPNAECPLCRTVIRR
jgi:hypothetical protein